MPERQTLLVEIGTEELPPRALLELSSAFANALSTALESSGLSFATVKQFVTPRRLAVLIEDMPEKQPDQVIERKGPPVSAAFDAQGEPSKAAQGFAKSCGVKVDELETLKTDKGAWLYYRLTQPGQTTRQLLPEMIDHALAKLPTPRRMRWGAGNAEFVRPVHWIVLLFGDEIVDAEILGVKTGRQTRGHRFHHPQPLIIATPEQYASMLEKEGKVLADFQRRRARIKQQVEGLAEALGGQALIDAALLDEVTGLVEWPQALIGSFDERFLDIPQEVLITTMQGNQRCFPVVSIDGRLLPHFIVVSNIESAQPEKVRAGNERVIRPRFSDAAFFWQQDRRIPLASRRDALRSMVFQERLGSLFDKSERLERLAAFIAKQISVDEIHARRAAALSKCDLVTNLVFEFPNLQGIMGRYYAALDGEPQAVAVALDEQYMPRHAGDELPRTGVGQALAAADRLDTLIGIFAIGHRPTGEKDPFGLRRAALSVLRIIIERKIDLDLEELLYQAAAGLTGKIDAERAVPDVFNYVMERLRTYYTDRGTTLDVFNAVMACRPTRPLDFDRRVRAVQVFRQLPEAESLTGANKRIANILKQASSAAARNVEEKLLRDSAERDLYEQLKISSRESDPLFAAGRYEQALTRLVGLRQPIDRFFDEVLVMADDETIRNNRIALLNQLSRLFLRTADLSRLQ
jgi:glycyl-tRNA synthetase beta chain